MKIAVTGPTGMLGQDVVATFEAAGVSVTAVDRKMLNLAAAQSSQDNAASEVLAGHDVVINCAAWTAVDDAESREGEAFAVNAVGPAILARACRQVGAQLVHISSDYVFDGRSTTPYQEDAPVAPRTAYGRTKAAGEWAVRSELPDRHWILRTAWLYGAGGPNFVATMGLLAATRPTVDVVTDEIGQPTWTLDVAKQIMALIEQRGPSGVYHATSAGQTSWYEFAREIFRHRGEDIERVRPTTAAVFNRPAPRPAWSVLGHERWAEAGLSSIRPWQEALARAMAETCLGQAAQPRW